MPLYMGTRDVQLINHLNDEIINDIIDIKINLFKLSLYETEENLYGEALRKVYFPGVRVAGLIEHEDPSYDVNEFGPDITQSVTFNFHRTTLSNISLYPEVGDIIEYNTKQYEIDSAIENQFLAGQPDLNHSIICQTHLTKNSVTKLEKVKRAWQESVDSLYK